MEIYQKHKSIILYIIYTEYNTIPHNLVEIQGESIMLSLERTRKAIALLKNGRVPGPERIPAELKKDGTLIVLTEIFNRHLDGGPEPQTWNEGWINSVNKK